jgi:hypothetical protein
VWIKFDIYVFIYLSTDKQDHKRVTKLKPTENNVVEHKAKNEKYYNVGTAPKSNRKIVEKKKKNIPLSEQFVKTGKIDAPNTHILDCSLF